MNDDEIVDIQNEFYQNDEQIRNIFLTLCLSNKQEGVQSLAVTEVTPFL